MTSMTSMKLTVHFIRKLLELIPRERSLGERPTGKDSGCQVYRCGCVALAVAISPRRRRLGCSRARALPSPAGTRQKRPFTHPNSEYTSICVFGLLNRFQLKVTASWHFCRQTILTNQVVAATTKEDESLAAGLRACFHPRVAREPLARTLRHTPHQRTLRPIRPGSLPCRVGAGLGGGRGGARAAGGGGAAGAHRADLLVRRLVTNTRKPSVMERIRHVFQRQHLRAKLSKRKTRHVKSAHRQ
eukprot:COSAG04_NODE_4870_length_1851_cov_1.716324_2_plen_244_part_00